MPSPRWGSPPGVATTAPGAGCSMTSVIVVLTGIFTIFLLSAVSGGRFFLATGFVALLPARRILDFAFFGVACFAAILRAGLALALPRFELFLRAATRFFRRNKREATFLIGLTFAVLLLPAFATTQTLTGTVKNATTGKPAAGDEVVLLKLAQGMEEAGRTKADSKGNFAFKLDDAQSPHLVRAIHQEVTYHRMAPPGTTSVEVTVHDVAKKIDGIEVVADIMRIEVEQGQLEVTRAFAVQNTSKPPRTQMNERTPMMLFSMLELKITQPSAISALRIVLSRTFEAGRKRACV